jgi:CRP/FNR family transcriptional regulator
LHQLCLPVGLAPADVSRLDCLIQRPRAVRRGEQLYRPGEPIRCVHVVRSGSIKTYAPTRNGGHQIVSFHLPGELLGLEEIGEKEHRRGALALETSSVCAIPVAKLEELGQTVPGLRRHMFRVLSNQLQHERGMLVVLRQTRAEQRVAAFLLICAERFQRRGFSAVEFRLTMSRHDIGSYLGLTKETVCRVTTRLRTDGLIDVDRRHIRIRDRSALGAIASALVS